MDELEREILDVAKKATTSGFRIDLEYEWIEQYGKKAYRVAMRDLISRGLIKKFGKNIRLTPDGMIHLDMEKKLDNMPKSIVFDRKTSVLTNNNSKESQTDTIVKTDIQYSNEFLEITQSFEHIENKVRLTKSDVKELLSRIVDK